MSFKQYLIQTEESYKEEIKKTLNKLPKGHAALIKGFKFEFQGESTLKNDSGHVGLIDVNKKKIVIAAPWNYGREWTLLHELGHLIWEQFVTVDLMKTWKEIVKKTKIKKEDKQPPEEMFAHAYASHYAKNQIVKFDFPKWHNFIKNLHS